MMLNDEHVKTLEKFATQIRLETMKELTHLGFGHVGGALSVVETLAVLYGEVMRIDPIDQRENYTYLMIGDGECDEGQVWEGALFAAHQKLDHLIAFVDANKKQLDGYTKDINDLGDLRGKFEAPHVSRQRSGRCGAARDDLVQGL